MSKTHPSPIAQRRSAEEWSALIEEWKRSGLDLERFAARRGIRAKSLGWWRWRLKSEAATTAPDQDAATLRLVEVRVDDPPQSPELAAPAWELVTADGHRLRVDRDLDCVALDRVLGRLVGG